MRAAFATLLLLFIIAGTSKSEEPGIPDAPSPMLEYAMLKVPSEARTGSQGPLVSKKTRVIDRQFLALSAISTAAIFMDSYTTTWIGANYRARSYGACTVEGGEPLLYGLHPTVARTYIVGAGLSAGAIAASYLAKTLLPGKLKAMWSAPFLYETSVSVHGFVTNMARCNP